MSGKGIDVSEEEKPKLKSTSTVPEKIPPEEDPFWVNLIGKDAVEEVTVKVEKMPIDKSNDIIRSIVVVTMNEISAMNRLLDFDKEHTAKYCVKVDIRLYQMARILTKPAPKPVEEKTSSGIQKAEIEALPHDDLLGVDRCNQCESCIGENDLQGSIEAGELHLYECPNCGKMFVK